MPSICRWSWRFSSLAHCIEDIIAVCLTFQYEADPNDLYWSLWKISISHQHQVPHVFIYLYFLKRWIAGPMCNMSSPCRYVIMENKLQQKKRRLFKRVWDHKADQGSLKCRFFQDVLCFTGSVEGFTTDEWFEALIYLKFWRHTASAVVNLQNYFLM